MPTTRNLSDSPLSLLPDHFRARLRTYQTQFSDREAGFFKRATNVLALIQSPNNDGSPAYNALVLNNLLEAFRSAYSEGESHAVSAHEVAESITGYLRDNHPDFFNQHHRIPGPLPSTSVFTAPSTLDQWRAYELPDLVDWINNCGPTFCDFPVNALDDDNGGNFVSTSPSPAVRVVQPIRLTR